MKQNEMMVTNEMGLLDFLFLNIENKSKNNIKSLLKNGNIYVNNKSKTKFDYLLKKGDIVEIKYKVEVDNNHTIDIIYEDKDIIVINKPEGLLSIATDKEKESTAYSLVSNYLKKKNPHSRVFVVHRLDKDTSGVLLFAKNNDIKEVLQNNWNDLVTIRGYIAIVEGTLSNKEGTIKSWLKENKEKIVYSSNTENDGKEAITNYKVIKSSSNYSMLKITIDTGRKNQIRVHMKDIHHFVIGDKKYGSTVDPLKRLGLHANTLEFKYPITNKILHLEAPIPNIFYKLFK
jgi:RluA family pseudouridine synthase